MSQIGDFAASVNLVLQGVKFTWDVLQSYRTSKTSNTREGIVFLIEGSLHLRRYARAIDDYCDAVRSPHRSIEHESAIMLDLLHERAGLADYFSHEAYHLVVRVVPEARGSDAIRSGWFQRRAFNNWELAAQLLGDKIHGVTPEHLKLLAKIAESHRQYERDYAMNSAWDDVPLAPPPSTTEILPDEIMLADLERTAQGARDLASDLDKVVRDNWNVRDALADMGPIASSPWPKRMPSMNYDDEDE